MVYWDEIQVRYQIKKIVETEEGRLNLWKVLQGMGIAPSYGSRTGRIRFSFVVDHCLCVRSSWFSQFAV